MYRPACKLISQLRSKERNSTRTVVFHDSFRSFERSRTGEASLRYKHPTPSGVKTESNLFSTLALHGQLQLCRKSGI